MKHTAIAAFIVVLLTLMPNCMATAQSIDEKGGKIEVPPTPALENVRIDPTSTALLMLSISTNRLAMLNAGRATSPTPQSAKASHGGQGKACGRYL